MALSSRALQIDNSARGCHDPRSEDRAINPAVKQFQGDLCEHWR
jgi:hypothetical protein